jgi:CLASP N terminal
MDQVLGAYAATLANPQTAWDARAAALRDIAALADDSDGSSAAVAALTRALPALAPQLAAAVSELRSSVVRDACAAVVALSNTLGPAFAVVAAEPLTPVLLRASRVTIAVVAASAASAARALYTCCAHGVPPRVTSSLAAAVMSRGEKSHPAARAAAAEYLGLLIAGGVLDYLPERVADDVQAAVAAGCVDPAELVRDVSRSNWRDFRTADPRRAALVFESLPSSTQQLMSSADFRGVPAPATTALPAPLAMSNGLRAQAGVPRRAPQRPPVRSESTTHSLSPPVSARPPRPLPRKPPMGPKRATAESSGAEPISRSRRDAPPQPKPNPFAKRPARRSMAVGVTGPLFKAEPQEPVSTSAVSGNDVKLVSAGIVGADAWDNRPVSKQSKLAKALELANTSPEQTLPTSRSATDLSRSDSSAADPAATEVKSIAAVAPTTPSTVARRRSLADNDSEAEESEFSSAQGSPTPLPSGARTPSPARAGLSALLDDEEPNFSPGSPLFPPTPEAVRQAARKARISFLCGPNISPGPFQAPMYAMHDPPVALMLPIREHRRRSMSSQSSHSLSPSPAPSRFHSIGRDGIAATSSAAHGSPTASENDTDGLSDRIAAFDLGEVQTESDRVAISALLAIGRGLEAQSSGPLESQRGEVSEDIEAYLDPLPPYSEPAEFGSPNEQLALLASIADTSSVTSPMLSSTTMAPCVSVGHAAVDSFASRKSDENLDTNSVSQGGAPHQVSSVPASPTKSGEKHNKEPYPTVDIPRLPRRLGSPAIADRRASTPVLSHAARRQAGSKELADSPDRNASLRGMPRSAAVSSIRGPRRSFMHPKGGQSGPLYVPETESVVAYDVRRDTTRGSSRLVSDKLSHGPGRHASESAKNPPTLSPPGRAFSDALRSVELSRSDGWEARVRALSLFQVSCKHLDGDMLDARLALRAVSVLSEMTTDAHIKVVPAALDSLFAILLGVESQTPSDSQSVNPLQIALERRPEVVQRILVCLVDSRASTRVAAERVMHSLVAQFRPEVRAMQIVRAMSFMFASDKTRRGTTNIGSPKVMIVGCTHLLAAFRSAEASGEGFVWQPVTLLASLLETMAALLRDRRADVRGTAGPVVLAANLSLPPGAMKLALDALPLSAQDCAALQTVIAKSTSRVGSDDQESCRSETSVAGV